MCDHGPFTTGSGGSRAEAKGLSPEDEGGGRGQLQLSYCRGADLSLHMRAGQEAGCFCSYPGIRKGPGSKGVLGPSWVGGGGGGHLMVHRSGSGVAILRNIATCLP